MRYVMMVASLLILGCGGGEKAATPARDAEAKTESLGADVAETLGDAQDAAATVEEELQESKDAIDAALDDAD